MIVIYNICGISGRENVDYYAKAINSILAQKDVDFELVISSCRNKDADLNALRNKFPEIKIYQYTDKLPVNVTFNKTCDQARPFGDDVLYVDSGIIMNDKYIISEIYSENIDKYCMISTSIDNDDGSDVWGELQTDIVPVGKAVNLHCQLFSGEYIDFYEKPIPDIFASHCTESTFSFLCAAIGREWKVRKDIVVNHKISLDGMSSGFNPVDWVMQGRLTFDHPFVIPSILSRICTQDGWNLGFGYEECRNVMLHDPNQYNNNICKNDVLKHWLKEKLFLRKWEFNYDKIAFRMF